MGQHKPHPCAMSDEGDQSEVHVAMGRWTLDEFCISKLTIFVHSRVQLKIPS
jgi:hypothetical protein